MAVECELVVAARVEEEKAESSETKKCSKGRDFFFDQKIQRDEFVLRVAGHGFADGGAPISARAERDVCDISHSCKCSIIGLLKFFDLKTDGKRIRPVIFRTCEMLSKVCGGSSSGRM